MSGDASCALTAPPLLLPPLEPLGRPLGMAAAGRPSHWIHSYGTAGRSMSNKSLAALGVSGGAAPPVGGSKEGSTSPVSARPHRLANANVFAPRTAALI